MKEVVAVGTGEDGLILIYTSGTTGEAKGVEVPVKALAAMEAYMRFGLDLRDEDVYWKGVIAPVPRFGVSQNQIWQSISQILI